MLSLVRLAFLPCPTGSFGNEGVKLREAHGVMSCASFSFTNLKGNE